MNKKEQGQLLRQWREHVGDLRGRPLTLMEAAELIADECERQGVSEENRRVPRSHASLTRWELGNVDQKVEGLGIIAKAYGINAFDLMVGPPPVAVARARERAADRRK